MEGNWLGSWAGKWYGAGAETPEGSIAGSSSLTVTASGIPSALAFILGAAGLSITGNGTLTASGGEVSNPTLDLILAILTGRKVYDPETKLWHVFDANGVEIVDPSGVLMQGLHGWLLRGANEVQETIVPSFANLGAHKVKKSKRQQPELVITEALPNEYVSRIRDEFMSAALANDLINRAKQRKSRAEEEALLLLL